MSYQIGIDTIHLRPTPRIAHTEYCSNDPLIRAVTKGRKSFNDAWDFDFIWNSNDGPVGWGERGRVTDMGHAEFLEGGVDRREPKPSPFKSVEEVLDFDAVKEYGLPDFARLVAYYEETYRKSQAANPNQVFPGGYYKTVVSGAIEAFGWEMLLLGAADKDRFERVLDSIFQLSLHHYKAWAKTSIKAFVSHDDMVWSQGPFMHPDFYRRAIFPRYKALWKVLKDAGIKVLFCSDGDWTPFIDDIAAAGADGFIFEPMTSLDKVVSHYGGTHVIVSSRVDCRTLTFGTKKDIQGELDATLPLARKCPGFVFAVGNHIPSNVPVQNALFYFGYLKKHWRR
ncbi:MAG: hypothetical protein NTW87_30630 [Planctomycetota bacterium]|nr:hypothetical protein [Planctomycetota bacterium]